MSKMNASRVLTKVTWVTFFVGLITITIAYLSATFAGGSNSLSGGKALKNATAVGTTLMYLGLLMMPAIPVLYHTHKKDENNYDWAAAGAQWFSYILLPVALYLWDQPQKAKIGAGVLALSISSLVASIFLTRKAHQKRHPNSPSSGLALY
jgi:hypothetical protein